MTQPIGHAHQMPMAPNRSEKKKASTTRRIRSVKVAAINAFMAPAPRSTPSVTSFADTTK